MKKSYFLFIAVTLISLTGCKKSPTEGQAKKEVNLAIWSNYVTDEMLAQFTQETGFKVIVSNYSSNEELLAKLQAGASGIDVAVPSDYMVFAMIQMGLLQPLNRAEIANAADLDPKLLGKEFDPENKFSLPFDWGTTGIALQRKLFKGNVKGWNELFSSQELKGKFTLLDDVREAFGAALKANGLSLNATDETQIKKAQATLESIRKSVKAFTSETLAGLSAGEMAAAHAYSSDALQARKKTGGQVDFLIPEEGCTWWIDTLVMPKTAQNPEGAYALINFLLSASIGAERTQKIFVAPANIKSAELLPEDLQKNMGLFPSEAQLAKCEMMKDLGESLAAYDRAWTMVKVSK